MQTDLFSSRSACQTFSALPARAWEIPLQPFPGLSPEMHTQNESIQSLSTFLFLVTYQLLDSNAPPCRCFVYNKTNKKPKKMQIHGESKHLVRSGRKKMEGWESHWAKYAECSSRDQNPGREAFHIADHTCLSQPPAPFSTICTVTQQGGETSKAKEPLVP